MSNIMDDWFSLANRDVMGHLTANRKTGQKIIIQLVGDADPKPVLRCLSAEGIRIKILSVLPHIVRIDVRTPHGVIANKSELISMHQSVDRSLSRLTLSRRTGEEIVVLPRKGKTVADALNSLAHHCIELEVSEIRRSQVRIWVRAAPDLYVARNEIIDQGAWFSNLDEYQSFVD